LIYRATDAAIHNAIANHPEVKPTLSYTEEYADFTPLFDHPDDYILLHDGNGAASIFEWSAPGVWQGHSMFLPEARGRAGIQSGKDMIAWMFDQGARMIWGQTPLDKRLRGARMFNRFIGFKASGTGVHHVAGPVQYFIFERE
jgi:hypothetical protein